MRRALVALACLAVAGVALAQTTGISGHVYDLTTRQPIVGATVCCYFGNDRTDSAGYYLIADLQPRRYRVRAMASGYETGYYPESVLVVQGRVTENIDFYLVPAGQPQHGAISGRVSNSENGQTIAGAVVVASSRSGSREVIQAGCPGYLIDSLPPDIYWVSATAPGFEPGHFPDSVGVIAGQTSGNINFQLRPTGQNPGSISGRVTDGRTGAIIRHATVRASGPNGSGEVTQCCHGYQIGDLPAGMYWVTAEAQGYEPGHYRDSVEVLAGQTTERIDFALEPSGPPPEVGSISGEVTDASSGDMIRGARVTASCRGVERTVLQHCCHGYRIDSLPPGRYWVSATAEGYEPGHYRDSVEVVAGQNTPEIDFALSRSGAETGEIAGAVFNGVTREPIFGALVRATGPSRGQANTCRQGRFRIRDLEPGLYLVEASARGFEPTQLDSVEVEAGQTTELTFQLQPVGGRSGAIAGTVRDSATGRGIPNATVFAWGRAGQGSAQTDSSGDYLIANLPAGEYRARACARGYYCARYPSPVQVVAGGTAEGIDFMLLHVRPGDAGIAGFVYDGIEQTEVGNAHVFVIGANGSRDVYADEYGDYLVDGLEPGEYELEVEAQGYSPEVYPELVVVEAEVVNSFVSPAVYPLTGAAELRATRLEAEPAIRVVPNPSSGPATISLQIRKPGLVTVQVVDNAGRTVRTLHNGRLSLGAYNLTWDGTGDSGAPVTNGIYFFHLKAAGCQEVSKAVISR